MNRVVLARLLNKIVRTLLLNIVIKIIKPLYSILEARTYWFRTYNKHYKEKLRIESSTYDLCLLILIKDKIFGIVRI